jgi:glucose/arabinose dehydrogenase
LLDNQIIFPSILTSVAFSILIFQVSTVIDIYDFNAQLKNDSTGSTPIIISDPNLKSQVVFEENIEFETTSLSPVGSMAFLSPNEILLLDKSKGLVKKIMNGTLIDKPLIDVAVGNHLERGLVGIATSVDVSGEKGFNNRNITNVYLYFTKSSNSEDGKDNCPRPRPCFPKYEPLGNRLYKYQLKDDRLTNPKLLLDLPAEPGTVHNGGALLLGPDNNIYIVVGDLVPPRTEPGSITKAENYQNGTEPDGRAGILRITQDGAPVEPSILGDTNPLNKYYAYGIRNSFGMDFDPVSGKLWDAENGPVYGDEINLVEPGFNSGWRKVQGIWKPVGEEKGALESHPEILDFDGKGKYSTPEFIWNESVAPTALKFLDSDKLGKQYENDMFVGDVNNGNIYRFELNKDRNELKLDGVLKDRIANSTKELTNVIFAKGFGVITDIEVGPKDGYLYVLSYKNTKVTITRILP